MATPYRSISGLGRRLPQATSALSGRCGFQHASRLYHSYDHPSTPETFNSSEKAILSAAYSHVPAYGFTTEALARGAKESGYPDISASILPDGVFSLIRFHLVTKREELAKTSKDLFGKEDEAAKFKINEKVERLTWERLLANKQVLPRWQEALAIMAQPSYMPASLKELAMLSDEIWFRVGDASVDSSWYTKRASLSTIYASSELFMTSDRSAGFQNTREFLNRRLGEVKDAGSVLGSLQQWVGFTASAGVNVLRSKGVRI